LNVFYIYAANHELVQTRVGVLYRCNCNDRAAAAAADDDDDDDDVSVNVNQIFT